MEFLPFALDTFGLLHPKSHELLKRLARRNAETVTNIGGNDSTPAHACLARSSRGRGWRERFAQVFMGDGVRGDEDAIVRRGCAWRVVNSAASFEG